MTMVHEGIEWQQLYWYDTHRGDRPRVLLVGDSIVVGYRDYVREGLKDRATVTGLSTSKCVGDADILDEVAYAVKRYPPAVIHFNNGLHGFDFADEPAYGRYLAEFVVGLKKIAPRAALIWASSTPVSAPGDAAGLDPKINPRVVERNRLAQTIMAGHAIAVNDLYSLMLNRPELRLADQYHYNEAGQKVQAAQVVAVLQERGLQ